MYVCLTRTQASANCPIVKPTAHCRNVHCPNIHCLIAHWSIVPLSIVPRSDCPIVPLSIVTLSVCPLFTCPLSHCPMSHCPTAPFSNCPSFHKSYCPTVHCCPLGLFSHFQGPSVPVSIAPWSTVRLSDCPLPHGHFIFWSHCPLPDCPSVPLLSVPPCAPTPSHGLIVPLSIVSLSTVRSKCLLAPHCKVFADHQFD
jgi:hypothetical protein